MCGRFGTLCSIFIVRVKKNNWDEIARVKFWLKRSLGQSEGGRTRRGRVRLEEQDVDGNGPQVEAFSQKGMLGRNSPFSEGGRGTMGW